MCFRKSSSGVALLSSSLFRPPIDIVAYMGFHSVRLLLELPGELVVMEVPKVESERCFKALDV